MSLECKENMIFFNIRSRSHYSHTFTRREKERNQHELQSKKKEFQESQTNAEMVLFAVGSLFMLIGYLSTNYLSSFDKPSKKLDDDDR